VVRLLLLRAVSRGDLLRVRRGESYGHDDGDGCNRDAGYRETSVEQD
jgi:hypothetical protein